MIMEIVTDILIPLVDKQQEKQPTIN